MYLEEFIKQLQRLKKDFKQTHIQVIAQNGTAQNPEIRIVLKDNFDVLNKSKDNVAYLLIILRNKTKEILNGSIVMSY